MLELIKGELTDEKAPFGLLVTGRIQSGKEELFRQAAQAVQAATQREEGCQMYQFYLKKSAKNEMILMESWKDFASLVAHFEEPHLLKFFDESAAFFDGEVTAVTLAKI